MKVTGHTFSCNDLTNFKYQVHAMTGNGNFANLFEFAWKILEISSGENIFWRILALCARRTVILRSEVVAAVVLKH